jgi:hypothetical protein
VASNGTLIAGKGFVSAHRIKLAEYRLDSDVRDSFADCAISGMAERFKVVHFVSTTSNVITLHVREFRNAEPPDTPAYLDADGEFSLVVICPAT